MKTLIVQAPGKIEYVELPYPKPGPHDVVSRVCYCGICGTDGEIFHGDTSLAKKGMIHYPVRIGHEWSGIVEEVGSEVTDFKPGDRVISDTGASCERCEACLKGNYKKCRHVRSLGTAGDIKEGAFTEHFIIRDWHMHKLPDSISLQEAALIEPCTISLTAVRGCNISENDVVLVTGTGAIGLTAVAIAKSFGAKVLLAGRKDFKLNIGLQMGADAVTNTTKEDLTEFVKRETGGEGLTVLIETTGNVDFVRQGLDLVRYRGIIGMLAFYEEGLDGFDINRQVMEHKSLLGLEGSDFSAPDVIAMLEAGKIKLKPMITDVIDFDRAADAIRDNRVNTARRIKTLVRINPEEQS